MIHGPFISHDKLVFLAPYATQRDFISKKICLVQYAFTFLLGIYTSIVLGDVRCCLILYVARIFTTISWKARKRIETETSQGDGCTGCGLSYRLQATGYRLIGIICASHAHLIILILLYVIEYFYLPNIFRNVLSCI